MRISFKALLAFAAVLTGSCAAPPEAVEEAPPVDLVAARAAAQEALDQFRHAIMEEDLELLSRLVAPGPNVIVFGTDAAERWVGHDEFMASVEVQFASYEDTEIMIRDQVLTVHSSGKVAWFSQVMDWHLTAGGDRVESDGMRYTGVMEERDGVWVIVQAHVSVGVQGQVMEY